MNSDRILIADDHPVFRAGLKQIIQDDSAQQEFLEASDGKEAFRLIREYEPAVAVLDVKMPGLTGLQIAEQLNGTNLKTKVILLTMFDNKNFFIKAMELGVKGYLLKDSSANEIVSAIAKVKRGDYYLSPELSSMLLPRKGRNSENGTSSLSNILTDTEIKIIRLVANLKSNNEISAVLNISKRTVENHKVNMAKKLGLGSSKELLRYALENIADIEML